jgi:sortase (surface protein transpeptidase)
MDLPIRPADYVTYQQNGQLVSDWNVPFDAAGHLSTTAQPGELGNAVLSGHHNLVGPNKFGLGKFAGLWNLAQGDEIRVKTADGAEELWRVTDSFPIKEAGEPLSVRIQHAEQILGDTTFPRLTLLTCWNGPTNPLSGNTYRWVIQAELVSVNKS